MPDLAMARAFRARYWTFVPVWYSNCKSDSRIGRRRGGADDTESKVAR